MSNAVHGLSQDSMFNMQLDAGAFFVNAGELPPANTTSAKDFYEEYVKVAKENGKCLGATAGGGTFKAVPEVREIEADGMRYAIKGSTVIDKWDVSFTTTLKEITGANWKHIIATSDVDEATGAIKIRSALTAGDYIESIVWVGTKNDGGILAISLDNALNISGAELTFVDKGEGTIPCEFKGHVSDLDKMDFAPATIHEYLPEIETGG